MRASVEWMLDKPTVPEESSKWSPQKQVIRRKQLGRGLAERPRLFERVHDSDFRDCTHVSNAPKALVLDCDACLIWPETWLTEGGPYTPLAPPIGTSEPPCLCADSANRPIALFPSVPPLLRLLATSGSLAPTSVHIASRSTEPAWLEEILTALGVVQSDTSALHGAAPLRNVHVESSLSKAEHVQRIAQAESVSPRECMLLDNEHEQCYGCERDCGALAEVSAGGISPAKWNTAIERFERESHWRLKRT